MDTKKVKFPHGIPGHNLSEVEREIPTGEPPAWPINDDLKVVGKRVKRTDALAKVTGAAKYTSDIQLQGMLFGRMLRSNYPHAKIKSIDTSAAEKYDGVYAVHVFKNAVGMAQAKDGGNSAGFPDVKFAGQPIAGVAAISVDVAEEALKLIKVDYEYLPFVVDLEEAQKPEAPVVFKTDVDQEDRGGGGGGQSGLKTKGNLRGPSTSSFFGGPRGDVEKGFETADFIVEHVYRTQVHTHCSLETHGVVVDWRPDNVTIYASTQNTNSVRHEFAEMFDLPKSKVRVITEFMGGGFGAKHSLGNFGVMAGHLSKKSGRPVSMMLDRKEEHISSGNRPNSVQYLKIGAKKDGTLTAIKQKSHGTAGVGLGAGVGRIAQVMYECPNFSTEQYDVFTHAGPGAAWRAPGNVQGAFGLEQAMDELAEKLNMDPLALRDVIDKSDVRKVERQRGAKQFDWSRRKKPGSDSGTVKKGLGMAQSTWPRFVNLNSTVEIRAYKDGAIEVRSGVQDIGTGTKTILAQVVAEELGMKPEDITIRIGDTLFPTGPGSGGSIVTGSITPPARNAAYKLKLELFDQVAKELETVSSKLSMSGGFIVSQEDNSKKIAVKDALKKMRTEQITTSASRSDDYGGFKMGSFLAHGDLGSVQFAEVSVDTETGFVKVDKIVAAHSCGRPLNITQLEGQINGGVIQGVSYALYEYRVMDNETGHQMNGNLDQYKLPFAMEIPEIETIIVEDYGGRSSTDAYGIGEPANIATAVAVANAVYNAIGVRIYELPITPDKVLKALNKI
ncbi:xanthine dehydrogenase family protein molybdopterin-binding subunit [Fulvivirgaceae bacterium BMA12]|uniref:Xanthine dehydrogenase family protein molybdopterin-binding subunit n=1 Tax=Agaribacillus aureus TaxID=3051825 RepID=A0ABT8L6X0_9BACT|nr:xanthine dehydrogenase family protein molybdopterin-binding subunit [Fulvivirgaceae bacterium BMA12]